MPSASTKVEIPASSEALDPFKRVLTVVDKKVRNLEKRKLKLDTLKQKVDSGASLEKDQQVAVDRYGEVIQNLEFARDLQKQFQCISTDVEKLLKKQAKRGKSEKQMQEVKRVKEVLQLQGLLDQMGSETVRQDFQTGKHGAIVLTEENLDQLDELYKMISPTRDSETDYLESLSEASEHIVCLLDAKDKPVVGTTSYKELKELLDLISQCGYFEKAQATEGVKEGGDVEFEVVEHTDVPAPDSEEVQSSLPPEVPAEEIENKPVATGQQIINNDTLNTQPQVITAQADAFFNTPVSSQTVEEQQAELAALQQQQRRPFQEIVSSVQGNFNFLQESTIEVEAKREFSPHMDPAVVAAHPMPQSQQSIGRPPSNQTPDTSGLHQTGFGSGATFGEQQSAFGDQQSLDSDLSVSKVSHGGSVDQSVYSQANMAPTQDFSGSGFSQSNLSHSLQTDSLFSGTVSSGDSNSGNRGGMMGKGENTSLGHSQYEIPPQLPMPPSHEQQAQDNQHQADSEKKGFNMNPNATEFQSLIYNQSGEEGESTNKSSNDGFQGGTYSNMNYNQREQRGGRGGFRGGRGGNRGGGGGNMSNGYSRGGRGNYQGYQNRDNYRSEGFQGNYSGNNYNNGGFQKRGDGGREGGRGGSSRGGNRGGQRGGGGFNRGGNTGGRGSARGTGQGFGRPNFNQQQQ